MEPIAILVDRVCGWKRFVDVMVVVKGQRDLLEVVLTLCAPPRFTSSVDGWEKANDHDHNRSQAAQLE
jgi:hypothetical protein